MSVKSFLEDFEVHRKAKLVISLPESHFDEIGLLQMNESKETTGRYVAYRHAPHFQGGEYHGHCDLPGGYQLSYTATGKRLHPNKFPSDDKVVKDAKLAIAKVLNIHVDIFESYVAYDEIEHKDVILLTLKSRATLLSEKIESFMK